MNHGYCQNCWWWLVTCKSLFIGKCYMQKKETGAKSYCPDYINRQKENKKSGDLFNLIKKGEIQI